MHTPVAFFIFNRPDETRRVFEAIRGACPPKLLVIADGPRMGWPDDRAACAATRAIIDEVDWECDVLRNFADTNLGVPRRFASAFRWVFEQVDEAIFLEHDTLPHPDFFPYCEQLLAHYRHEPRVMWIGGSNVWGRRFGEASYFINRTNAVWGWATWKRAWVSFDIEVRGFPEFKRQRMIERITPSLRMQAGFLALFDRAYHRQWDNWDAQSTFAIWSHDGLAIHPNVNLVTNIGFGPQAENTRTATDPLASLPPWSPWARSSIHPICASAPTSLRPRLGSSTRTWDMRWRWRGGTIVSGARRSTPLPEASSNGRRVLEEGCSPAGLGRSHRSPAGNTPGPGATIRRD